MAIIAKAEGNSTFTPHPEGQYAAVCVDVHDLGMIDVTWQGETKRQHKIDIYWYADEDKTENGRPVLDDEGNPVHLFVRSRFTLSLAENSRLRPFLQAWRGKKFTPEEERGFDVERLIGAPAFLQIDHAQVGDKVYANVTTIMKLPKGMTAPEIPGGFVRICDRPPREEQPQTNGRAQPAGTHREPWPDAPPPDYEGDPDGDLPF